VGLLSEKYPPFEIKQEKFQDQDAYLELRDLVQELESFRNDVIEALNDEAGFHDRGDPGAYDKDDFTTDGDWHDWDLSAIVPAGAKAVLLRIMLQDDAVASWLQFRENGNSNAYNYIIVRTQVANVVIDADAICSCDSDRVIEYRGADLAFTSTRVIVKGWWK